MTEIEAKDFSLPPHTEPMTLEYAIYGPAEWRSINPKGTAHPVLCIGSEVICIVWSDAIHDRGATAHRMLDAWNYLDPLRRSLADMLTALDAGGTPDPDTTARARRLIKELLDLQGDPPPPPPLVLQPSNGSRG